MNYFCVWLNYYRGLLFLSNFFFTYFVNVCSKKPKKHLLHEKYCIFRDIKWLSNLIGSSTQKKKTTNEKTIISIPHHRIFEYFLLTCYTYNKHLPVVLSSLSYLIACLVFSRIYIHIHTRCTLLFYIHDRDAYMSQLIVYEWMD